jgi:hypothetical protein
MPEKKKREEDSKILLTFPTYFLVSMDDDDIDPDDFIENYYDEIIRHRTIARRTNWRMLFTSLIQREVALAATIQSSMFDYIQFIMVMIVTINQLMTGIYVMRMHHLDQNNLHYKMLLHLYIYFSCLTMFCFYELDALLEQEYSSAAVGSHRNST